MRNSKIISILLIAICLTGCEGAPVQSIPQQQEDYFFSMEEEPELSYEVPVSIPSILINQQGYMIASTKVAVFTGEKMPEAFNVINAQTGETAYVGSLENRGYNEESLEYNSYGDFTELTEPGIYYIEAPILGRSYPFAIGNTVYDEIFREACKQYYYNRCGITLTGEYAGERAHNACHTAKAHLREDTSVSVDVTGGWHQDERGQKDVVTAATAMSVILLSYELYKDSFTDDVGIPESGNEIPDILDEVRYEADWLLKMQDQQTGAVYEGITVYPQSGDAYVEPASVEAEKAFAMCLAKFSYVYQAYDTEYATACLRAADRAWKHARLNDSEAIDEWAFAAAAELYRASGQRSYHAIVQTYLNTQNFVEPGDEIVLLGSVTYIATKQRVDVSLCEKIMKMLMDRAESISENARKSVYLAVGNSGRGDNDRRLMEMLYLTVVDHIISNHEYSTIIENHLHYFMGRNEQAVSYLDDTDSGNPGIMKRFDADSRLILMLSEIVNRKNN